MYFRISDVNQTTNNVSGNSPRYYLRSSHSVRDTKHCDKRHINKVRNKPNYRNRNSIYSVIHLQIVRRIIRRDKRRRLNPYCRNSLDGGYYNYKEPLCNCLTACGEYYCKFVHFLLQQTTVGQIEGNKI